MVEQTSRPEAIIFDFGFVLTAPVDPAAFEANKASLAVEYGFEKAGHMWGHIFESEAWQLAKRGKMTEDDFWADRLAAFGIEGKQATAAFIERLFQHAEIIHPDMRQLLDELRPNYRLAVLSNIEVRDMARWLEKQYGLKDIFEVVVGSADVGLAKPEPEIYQLVLEKLSLPPEKALFIDDLSRNTKAAEALGLPSIRFESPAMLRTELEARRVV